MRRVTQRLPADHSLSFDANVRQIRQKKHVLNQKRPTQETYEKDLCRHTRKTFVDIHERP